MHSKWQRMGHIVGISVGTPVVGVAIVVAVVVVTLGLRIYMLRHPGTMRAKCPKCGAVFDASRSLSGIHIGPIKQYTCPACGQTSFMKTYVKDSLTYPTQTSSTQPENDPSAEEQEKRRIEESKYENP